MSTTAALVDAKLNRRFDLLDSDGDGYLTVADYDLIVDRLLEVYRPAPDSPIAAEVRAKFMRLWVGLKNRADSDGDDKVSREEYVKAARAGMAERDGGYDRVMRPVQEVTLRLAGCHNSGGLSAEQFARLMGTVGVDPAYAASFFATVDTNNDGEISTDEYLAVDREFYCSHDPAAPGNHLYGRLDTSPA